MGQRTQVILKLKDVSGNVVNKVYHMQWGYNTNMARQFALLMLNLYEGEFSEVNSSHRKPNTEEREKLQELDKVNRLQLEEDIKKYSIHNLEIRCNGNENVIHITDEYKNDMVNTETGETFTVENQDGSIFGADIAPENAVKLLNWDFDIHNPHHIRAFEGDNNNGYMAVEVEEFVTKTSYGSERFDTKITVGFVMGYAELPEKYDDNPEEYDDWNRVLTCKEYMNQFRNDNNKEYQDGVLKLYDAICSMYDVHEVGKELVNT